MLTLIATAAGWTVAIFIAIDSWPKPIASEDKVFFFIGIFVGVAGALDLIVEGLYGIRDSINALANKFPDPPEKAKKTEG